VRWRANGRAIPGIRFAGGIAGRADAGNRQPARLAQSGDGTTNPLPPAPRRRRDALSMIRHQGKSCQARGVVLPACLFARQIAAQQYAGPKPATPAAPALLPPVARAAPALRFRLKTGNRETR